MTTKRWPRVPLGRVVEHRKEFITIDDVQTYRRLRVQLHAQGIVLRDVVPGALIKTKQQQVCHKGEFLVAEIDAKVGGYGIVPNELDGSIVSGHYFLFTLDESQLDRQFLEYFLRTSAFRQQVRAQGSTNYAAIRPADVLAYEIPLPSLKEQQQLVVQLREFCRQIDALQALRRQTREETEILLSATVCQYLKFGSDRDWVKRTLGDYVVDTRYGTSEKTTDDETGIPILRMGNIQDGRLDLADLKYLHLSVTEREKLLLRPGDILVNRTNSAELVGKCAVFDLDGEYSFASYLIRIRLDQSRADPRLVAALINSPVGRAYMLDEKRQMTGQANVNATKLKAFPLPLPPLSEQRLIMAELDQLQISVRALKELQAATATEMADLLPTMLDRAFTLEQ
jgi:type I restriction enzyme S subunit